VTEFTRLANDYPAQLAIERRKQQGAWFTPMELALPTAQRTLAPLLANGGAARLRIVDPAVGGGVFLVAAMQALRTANVTAREAAQCVFGIDDDAAASALAARVVHEAAGDDAALPLHDIATRVHHGDGLRDLEPGTFDAVLTNPPWETLQAAPRSQTRVAELRPHFHHQGRGKLFTYRLFVERALQLLRPGGRFGLIVPASLWFDRDAEPLRRLLLDHCEWEWLFGFENRQKVFAIDSRYRFGVVIGTKGGRTNAVNVAFGRVDVADWTRDDPPHTRYGRDELRELSPRSGAFVEVDARRDLDVLRRMHGHARPLLGEDGVFTWRQGDFNMTADRAMFVRREDAEANGHGRSDDAVWRRCGGDDLLPLLQGAMIGELHPNAGAHAGGTGHATTWETPRTFDDVRPAFLVPAAPWRADAGSRPCARIALRALSNATNERTAIACLVGDVPCGNSLGVLVPRDGRDPTPLRTMAAGAAVLASLAFDWSLRRRLVGTNLNAFVLADCVVPRLDDDATIELARLALRLSALLPSQRDLWNVAAREGWRPPLGAAIAGDERAALATRLDVLVGQAFGLQRDDVEWIVRGCDGPRIARHGRRGAPLPAKGFWRVDRELDPAARRPMRWLAALQR